MDICEFFQKYKEETALLFGFTFAILVGDYFVNKVPELLRNILKVAYPGKKLPDYVQELPRTVGLIERPILLSAFLANEPIIIGFWLTVKTASRWETWSKEVKGRVPGRATFNIFLAGNGLSLLYSFVGFMMIYWGTRNNYTLMVFVPVFLVLANMLLNNWLISRESIRREGINAD